MRYLSIWLAIFCITQLPHKGGAAEISWSKFRANGLYYLYITGAIEQGDYERFKAAFADSVRKQIELSGVEINSPGGQVGPSLKIGRAIRALGLVTYAPYRFGQAEPSCAMPGNNSASNRQQRCVCQSACFLIWVGGTARHGNRIQIHRIKFDERDFAQLDLNGARGAYEGGQHLIREYLSEMHVPEKTIRRMFQIPSDELSYLRADELEELNYDAQPYLNEWFRARCDSGRNTVCWERLYREWYFDNANKWLQASSPKQTP